MALLDVWMNRPFAINTLGGKRLFVCPGKFPWGSQEDVLLRPSRLSGECRLFRKTRYNNDGACSLADFSYSFFS